MDNSALSTIYPFGLSDSSSTQCLWANLQLFVNDKYLTVSSVLTGSNLTDFFPLVGQTATFPFATHLTIVSVQFSSVAHLCLTLCDPMNRSTTGLPVHHQFPESTQCPSSRWCHPIISFSVVPFSSCPQSLPASVFSNESTLHVRWPKYWSFSFTICPSNEHPGLISLQSKGLSRVFSSTTIWKHQFFSA